MLRYTGLLAGGILLAVGLLGASPAGAQGKHAEQWQQKHIRWERRYVPGPPYGRAYGYRARRQGQQPPYGRAYGYRANPMNPHWTRIPDRPERFLRRRYSSRVAGSRSVYRDFDRDGIPDSRDRDIDGDGVPNVRDRYDWNRFRW